MFKMKGPTFFNKKSPLPVAAAAVIEMAKKKKEDIGKAISGVGQAMKNIAANRKSTSFNEMKSTFAKRK